LCSWKKFKFYTIHLFHEYNCRVKEGPFYKVPIRDQGYFILFWKGVRREIFWVFTNCGSFFDFFLKSKFKGVVTSTTSFLL
jgi:hypothetical protein